MSDILSSLTDKHTIDAAIQSTDTSSVTSSDPYTDILPQTTSNVHSHTHNVTKQYKQSPTMRGIHLNAVHRQTTSPTINALHGNNAQQSPTLCSMGSPTQSHVHDDSCLLDNYNYSLDSYVDTDDTDSTIDSIDLADYTTDTVDTDVDADTVGVVICGSDKSITHINDAFTRITGYTTSDLLGRPSLSLLQGQDTSVDAVTTIRTAISQQSSCKVCLINYRKDGQPFWNLLTIVPMMNKSSNTVDAWIGIQRLHQPKPYIDKLLKMFPWTSNMPNNVVNNTRRKRHTLRHNQMLLQNSTTAQHRKLKPAHRDNTVTTAGDVDTTPSTDAVYKDDSKSVDGMNLPDSRHIGSPLSKPSMYRYSSVDDATDGEQDIYDIDEMLDNRDLATPTSVSFISETILPTQHGTYRVRAYKDDAKVRAANGHGHLLGSESEIICIIAGNVSNKQNVPVRVHDACFTSEVLGSLKCDCKEQLHWSMEYIEQIAQNSIKPPDNTNGHTYTHTHSHKSTTQPQPNYTSGGMIIYMPQEGRGIGLANKLKAYSLQTELGLDTVDANRALGFPDDVRSYNCVPAILESLNIKSVKLLTNNPRKIQVLQRLGVQVNGTVPVVVQPNSILSKQYMETKRNRMDHLMPDL